MGLPKAVKECATFLKLITISDDSQARLMLDLALIVAHQTETDKGRVSETPEPHFSANWRWKMGLYLIAHGKRRSY